MPTHVARFGAGTASAAVPRREGGGIGRRTGFRFQRRKAWGFESLPSHQRTGFSGMQTSIEALSRLERRLNMPVPAEPIPHTPAPPPPQPPPPPPTSRAPPPP